jgi:Rrf2 family protein
MLVSTRGRYSLRVLIDLAEHNNGEFIPLRDVAERQEISEKYLEGLLPVLTRHGFLEGQRGKGGGYRLAKPADSITALAVLSCMENLAPVACLADEHNSCSRAAFCKTLPMWQELYHKINAFFASLTIAQLATQNRRWDDFVI